MRTTRNPTKVLISSVLFLIQWLQLVTLTGASGTRVDLLTGKNGESSCLLKDQIYKGCQLTPPSTSNATIETPATCTCNKVFFNIWSACSYSSGINILPIFSDWNSICSSSAINLVQAQLLSESNTWGVDAPKWARIDVPGNATIDLQNAVLLVKPSWTVFQIILPIITAVGAVVVTLFVMLIYQRWLGKTQWGGRVRRLVRPIPRVQNVQKNDTWEIESSIDDARRYDLVPPAEGTYPFGPNAPTQAQAQKDSLYHGGHYKSNSESFSVDDSALSSSESWRVPASLKSFQMPWKKGRNRVQEVTATTEFDIDDYSSPTPTSSRFGFNDGDTGHKRVGSDERSGLMSSTDRPPSSLRDAQTVPVAPAQTLASKREDVYSDPFNERSR